MKPKTFRYNDIITFFEDARVPLSVAQKAVMVIKPTKANVLVDSV